MLTQFHNISTYIFEAGVYLLPHKLWGDDEDILHAERVLSSQPGRSCEGINSMGCQNFLVSFQAAICESAYVQSVRFHRSGR